MKFAELIAGDTRSNLERDKLAYESRLICQEIRTYQNLVAFALVSVVGVAYVVSLWHHTDQTALLIWYLGFSALSLIRAVVYQAVRKSLGAASAADLLRNEVKLAITGVAVAFWLGASYWVVGIPADERMLLAITALSCVYATGSTINSATQSRLLLIYLIVILGQAILFWIGFGTRTDYTMALLLISLAILLYAFALRNRSFIIEGVEIRLQNKAHNDSLIRSRALVEGALESALEANRSKSHVMAAVSHDLAQPVHALSYLLGALRKATDDEAARADIVRKIQSSVCLLERQFDGFVDLAGYDASDLEVNYRQFDLLAVCQLVAGNKEARAAKNHVEISLHGNTVNVVSDSVLLGRVISNLLDNAIKFGAGGKVQVRISQLDDWGVLEIEDAGIGISPDDLPKIFRDFVRLPDNVQPTAPGAGLGLAIVRRIAQALEVEVLVRSVPRRGTTFTLLVPTTRASGKVSDRTLALVEGRSIREFTDSAGSLAVPKVELDSCIILLVGNARGSLNSLSGYISDLGGRAVTANTLEQSLSLVSDYDVDLAFVDDWINGDRIGLQVGVELAEVLGQDKVVMLTANDSGQHSHDMEQAGFSVYPRPLKWSKLQAILVTRLETGLS